MILLRRFKTFSDLHPSHFPIVEEAFTLAVLHLRISWDLDSDKEVADYRLRSRDFFYRTNTIWLDKCFRSLRKKPYKFSPRFDENNTYVGYMK
jgi:hypothetical protein